MSSITDNALLERLVTDGISALPPDRLPDLITSLESRAVETGLAAPIFLAQALRPIDGLFEEDSESGGVRIGFLTGLDKRIRASVEEIQTGDPLQSAEKARALRDEIVSMVSSYDVTKPYDS